MPGWLSGLGLLGAVLYMAAGVLVLYGLEPLSTTQVALAAPLGVQQMALVLWLIIKGFNAAGLHTDATRESRPVEGAA